MFDIRLAGRKLCPLLNILPVVLASIFTVGFSTSVFAGFVEITVQNESDQKVNDAHIAFNNSDPQPTMVKIGDVSGAASHGGWDFSVSSGAVNLDHDGKLQLKYNNDNATINDKTSYWTVDGNPVEAAGSFKVISLRTMKCNCPDDITFTFFNDSSVQLIYDNITIYKDNELFNYNIDDFNIPTGVVIPGLPTSLVLDPAQSETISIGNSSDFLDGYVLGVADIAPTSDPTDFFFSALATTDCPEPPTWAMMILGFFGIGFAACHNRRMVGSSA